MEAVKMALSIFDRNQKIRLLPFVVTATFFLIQPYEPGTFLGTTFKVLPVLSLIGYVIVTRSQFPRKTKSINIHSLTPEDPYSFCILVGLCMSLVGDILVTIPYMMFLGGFLYMVIYLCYFIAIEVDGRHKGCRSSVTWLFGLLYINTFLCLQGTADEFGMKLFFLIYLAPLFLAGWKAASAMEENPRDMSVFMGCLGASLFILSDCLVISHHMEYPIPFAEFFYMLFYYGAQCGWALSTSHFSKGA
ncbi:lysoplasmalogenase-like [Dreissena polymorpha]|uniref:lysoplasmalogenase n=1 Tax=Dreissena polymorpha TaxID=45954 RepID=A0A9D4R226_DREPO|nr:lysoplasmalogenase-like [Dreissena polymorpha]XP_052275506.1 lysoplasmalogenase-like [Dreissena polymorpha]KAH3852074.1 hypothetical protein DPMN_094570 [Dreissena polymorpha]